MPRPKCQNNLKNPCYDTETRTDCPRRCEGCQFNCLEWVDYIKKRNTEYERKLIQNEVDYAICDCRSNHIRKNLKQKNKKY